MYRCYPVKPFWLTFCPFQFKKYSCFWKIRAISGIWYGNLITYGTPDKRCPISVFCISQLTDPAANSWMREPPAPLTVQRNCRLRVVSNFGDSDCGGGGGGANIHTRAYEISKRTRGKRAPLARGCVFSPAPRSLSPKLETTRSLTELRNFLETSVYREVNTLTLRFWAFPLWQRQDGICRCKESKRASLDDREPECVSQYKRF